MVVVGKAGEQETADESALRIAVITMVQASGLPHSVVTFDTLAPQLDRNRHHLVHVNDRRDVADRLPQHRWRFFETDGENLGVAGGRNALLHRATDHYDLVVSLDDDILVPSDYLDRIEVVWRSAAEQGDKNDKIGFICPALLDFDGAKEILYSDVEIESLLAGGAVRSRSTAELRRVLNRRFDHLPDGVVFHMGVRNWRHSYLGVAKDADAGENLVAKVPEALDSVLRGGELLPVETVPGGVAVYSTEMLREIGPTEPAFSPFGFEDSEHSIRALRFGYQNFASTELLLTHDFQGRNVSRDPAIIAETRGRMMVLLQRAHAAPAEIERSMLDGLLVHLVRLLPDPNRANEYEGWSPLLGLLCGIASGLVRPLEVVPAELLSSWGHAASGAGNESQAVDFDSTAYGRTSCRTGLRTSVGGGSVSAHVLGLKLGGEADEVDVDASCGFNEVTGEMWLVVRRGEQEVCLEARLVRRQSDPTRYIGQSVRVSRSGEGPLAAWPGGASIPRLWTWFGWATADLPAFSLEHPKNRVRSRGGVDVLFAPHNRYHAVEMVGISRALEKLGATSAFLDVESAYQVEGARSQLHLDGVPTVQIRPNLVDALGCRTLFLMNDWGGPQQQVMDAIRRSGGQVIALVEGVQDFNDDYYKQTGIGRIRAPYQQADWVFAVGNDDLRYLGRPQTVTTGSPRFERLFRMERNPELPGRVLVNVNFTYGVYEDQREAFVRDTTVAVADAGLEAIFSQHHADQVSLGDVPVSDRSLYEEFEDTGIVISRFSGVVLEAMARGIPVVYYNAFDEVIPKFNREGSTVFRATSRSELAGELRRIREMPLSAVREEQDRVFLHHVSVGELPSTHRIAVEVASVLDTMRD